MRDLVRLLRKCSGRSKCVMVGARFRFGDSMSPTPGFLVNPAFNSATVCRKKSLVGKHRGSVAWRRRCGSRVSIALNISGADTAPRDNNLKSLAPTRRHNYGRLWRLQHRRAGAPQLKSLENSPAAHRSDVIAKVAPTARVMPVSASPSLDKSVQSRTDLLRAGGRKAGDIRQLPRTTPDDYRPDRCANSSSFLCANRLRQPHRSSLDQ